MRRNYTVLIWCWTCDQVWSHQHSSQTVQLYGEECLTLTQQDISMILDRTTYTLSTVSVTPTWEVMSSPDCNVISLSHYILQILTAHRYHWVLRCERSDPTHTLMMFPHRALRLTASPAPSNPHREFVHLSVHLALYSQHCSAQHMWLIWLTLQTSQLSDKLLLRGQGN